MRRSTVLSRPLQLVFPDLTGSYNMFSDHGSLNRITVSLMAHDSTVLNKSKQKMLIQKEQHVFFAFSLIIKGTAEKVLQFMMPFKSIYSRNFGFNEQKLYF